MAAAVAQPLPTAALPALPPHVLAALGETLSKKGETLPSAAEMLQALSSATARELPVLLPRLCLYGAPSPAMLQPLLELSARLPDKSKDERKALRVVHFLLCRVLSECGAAVSGSTADAALSRLSAAAAAPDDDGLKLAACRALAAAAAGGAARAAAAVAAVLAAEAPRARIHKKKGLFKGGARAPGPARDDGAGGAVVAAHRGPLGAARRCPGVPTPWGKPPSGPPTALVPLSPAQLMAAACSADAIAARHGMAMLAASAVQRPAEAAAELRALVAAALIAPPLAPPVPIAAGGGSRAAAAAAALAAEAPTLSRFNLADADARAHFAALCSCLAHSGHQAARSSAARPGGSGSGDGAFWSGEDPCFWEALVALSRDANDRVALVAVRGLVGDVAPLVASSPADGFASAPFATGDGAAPEARARAWLRLSGGGRTALLSVVEGLTRAAGGAPLTAAALRAAMALARARSHALAAGFERAPPAGAILLDESALRLDRIFSAAASRPGAAAAPLRALAWAGLAWLAPHEGGAAVITPSAAAASFSGPETSAALLSSLFADLRRVIEAAPRGAAAVLSAAHAAALAAPPAAAAGAASEALPALWAAAASAGGAALEDCLPRLLAALRAAPQRAADGIAGASSRDSFEEAIVRFMGAHVAILEADGHPAAWAPPGTPGTPRSPGGWREAYGAAVSEGGAASAPLHAALSALHRSLVAGAPRVRSAAAEALALVALRSGAPHRSHAAALLASAVGTGLGLDAPASQRAQMLARMAAAAASLRARVAAPDFDAASATEQDLVAAQHAELVAAARRVCGPRAAVRLPLGAASAPLLDAWAARTGSAPLSTGGGGSSLSSGPASAQVGPPASFSEAPPAPASLADPFQSPAREGPASADAWRDPFAAASPGADDSHDHQGFDAPPPPHSVDAFASFGVPIAAMSPFNAAPSAGGAHLGGEGMTRAGSAATFGSEGTPRLSSYDDDFGAAFDAVPRASAHGRASAGSGGEANPFDSADDPFAALPAGGAAYGGFDAFAPASDDPFATAAAPPPAVQQQAHGSPQARHAESPSWSAFEAAGGGSAGGHGDDNPFGGGGGGASAPFVPFSDSGGFEPASASNSPSFGGAGGSFSDPFAAGGDATADPFAAPPQQHAPRAEAHAPALPPRPPSPAAYADPFAAPPPRAPSPVAAASAPDDGFDAFGGSAGASPFGGGANPFGDDPFATSPPQPPAPRADHDAFAAAWAAPSALEPFDAFGGQSQAATERPASPAPAAAQQPESPASTSSSDDSEAGVDADFDPFKSPTPHAADAKAASLPPPAAAAAAAAAAAWDPFADMAGMEAPAPPASMSAPPPSSFDPFGGSGGSDPFSAAAPAPASIGGGDPFAAGGDGDAAPPSLKYLLPQGPASVSAPSVNSVTPSAADPFDPFASLGADEQAGPASPRAFAPAPHAHDDPFAPAPPSSVNESAAMHDAFAPAQPEAAWDPFAAPPPAASTADASPSSSDSDSVDFFSGAPPPSVAQAAPAAASDEMDDFFSAPPSVRAATPVHAPPAAQGDDELDFFSAPPSSAKAAPAPAPAAELDFFGAPIAAAPASAPAPDLFPAPPPPAAPTPPAKPSSRAAALLAVVAAESPSASSPGSSSGAGSPFDPFSASSPTSASVASPPPPPASQQSPRVLVPFGSFVLERPATAVPAEAAALDGGFEAAAAPSSSWEDPFAAPPPSAPSPEASSAKASAQASQGDPFGGDPFGNAAHDDPFAAATPPPAPPPPLASPSPPKVTPAAPAPVAPVAPVAVAPSGSAPVRGASLGAKKPMVELPVAPALEPASAASGADSPAVETKSFGSLSDRRRAFEAAAAAAAAGPTAQPRRVVAPAKRVVAPNAPAAAAEPAVPPPPAAAVPPAPAATELPPAARHSFVFEAPMPSEPQPEPAAQAAPAPADVPTAPVEQPRPETPLQEEPQEGPAWERAQPTFSPTSSGLTQRREETASAPPVAVPEPPAAPPAAPSPPPQPVPPVPAAQPVTPMPPPPPSPPPAPLMPVASPAAAEPDFFAAPPSSAAPAPAAPAAELDFFGAPIAAAPPVAPAIAPPAPEPDFFSAPTPPAAPPSPPPAPEAPPAPEVVPPAARAADPFSARAASIALSSSSDSSDAESDDSDDGAAAFASRAPAAAAPPAVAVSRRAALLGVVAEQPASPPAQAGPPAPVAIPEPPVVAPAARVSAGASPTSRRAGLLAAAAEPERVPDAEAHDGSPAVLPPTPGLFASPPGVAGGAGVAATPPPEVDPFTFDPFASPLTPASPSTRGPRVDFRQGLVLYDFNAEADSELSVAENMLVSVRFENGVKHVADGWVSVSLRDGATGLVPETYVAVDE